MCVLRFDSHFPSGSHGTVDDNNDNDDGNDDDRYNGNRFAVGVTNL